MPKRVPANPAKSGTNSGREQVSSLDRPRPSRPPRPVGTWEKPIGVLCVCGGFLLIFEKESCQRSMHRQTPVLVGRLDFIHLANYKSSMNVNLTTSPIKNPPP